MLSDYFLSAAPGDYAATTLPVVFPSGSTPPEQRCINIPINDDLLVEFPESFSVSASTNDPNAVFTAGRDTATVNIADNDGMSNKLVVMGIATQCYL